MKNDPPLAVHELTPAEVKEWAKWEDRVSCSSCGHKSGARCIPLKVPHVPVHLLHRCESFAALPSWRRK